MIRVVIVDDQQLLRRGLNLLIETTEGIEVVAEAADGREALAVIGRFAPDVVLTDARMPVMDGVELVAEARVRWPDLPVLVLTTFDDDDLVRGAMEAGAAGFLLKDSSPEALADAVHSARDGGMVLDPRIARIALGGGRGADRGGEHGGGRADDVLAVLTRAERLVAEHLSLGRTNREIADELVLAEGTVKNHVSAMLHKLHQRDRTGLALLLYRTLHRGG